MYYCTKCGAELKDDETVCTNCGTEPDKEVENRANAVDADLKKKRLQTSYTATVLKVIILCRLIHTALVVYWPSYMTCRLPLLRNIEMFFTSELSHSGNQLGFWISMILIVIPVILIILSYCRMFQKCGYPGWGVIVPFYNIYCVLGIAGASGMTVLIPYGITYSYVICSLLTPDAGGWPFFLFTIPFALMGLMFAFLLILYGFIRRFDYHGKTIILIVLTIIMVLATVVLKLRTTAVQLIVLVLGFLWTILIISMGWGNTPAISVYQCHEQKGSRMFAAILIGLSILGNSTDSYSGFMIPSVSDIMTNLHFEQEYDQKHDQKKGTEKLTEKAGQGSLEIIGPSHETTFPPSTDIRHRRCPSCGGNGQVLISDRTVCGICGGSGLQYIPNQYYDQIMGWMGGYIACSGCGGSGYVVFQYWVPCFTCNGTGRIV